MPYVRDSFFNPSDPYKKAWSLAPKGRVLNLSGHKTGAMYATLSSAIPIFYILMLSAIAFDVYLGYSILAKSGVNIGLITGSVILDLILAIAPFLLGSFILSFNHTNVDNQLFKTKLECMTKVKGESDDDFHTRITQLKSGVLKELKGAKTIGKLVNYLTIILIFAIAGWKIYTYYSVLPPGFSIFSVANGKIVLIFSFLCAVCHIIGSEKAFAHLSFWFINKKEFKAHNDLHNGKMPPLKSIPIPYEGDYKPAKFENTELIIDENGNPTIEYVNLIWDDEIKYLIDQQGDDNAKRGVAITCKQAQII